MSKITDIRKATSKKKPIYKLRWYDRVEENGRKITKRIEKIFKTKEAMHEFAERKSIENESNAFFRWYEPLDSQLKGEHW